MAKNNVRHNKIIEIISSSEIETQDELVQSLRDAGFDVTQATISRDIKELGLIKIISKNKKYKYSVASMTQTVSDKNMIIYRDCVQSVVIAQNLVVIKTLVGTAGFVASVVENMAISEVLGVTYGNNTVLIVTADLDNANIVYSKLK